MDTFNGLGMNLGNLSRLSGAVTHSLVMRSKTMTVRHIESEHHFEREPDYGI